MSTTLNKLNYLKETKSQIKTALNQFGAGITNDTFRSYVSKISDIYANWTKVTDEDSQINLTPTRKGKMNLTLKSTELTQATKILPNEYTQVDYIESSGAQYIDTNFVITSAGDGYSSEMDIQYTEASTGSEIIISTDINAWFGQAGGYYAVGGSYKSSVVSTQRVTVKASFGSATTLIINGETIERRVTNSTGNVSIFGRQSFLSHVKLFKCKIYDSSNVLVRDFIPCYRNSDNEVGLYDIVNGVFYTNQGTGAFTYGSEVSIPNPDSPVNVNVIKGENNVKVENKNLVYQTDFSDNKQNKGYVYPSLIKENMTVSFIPNTSVQVYFWYYVYADGVVVSSYNTQITVGQRNSHTFTFTQEQLNTLNNASEVCFMVQRNNGININDLQVEQGSTATEYTPHQEQNYPISLGTLEYCKIRDYEDKFIRTSGKNLAYTGWAEDYVSRINDSTKAKLEIVDGRNCLNYSARAGYQEYDTKYIFKTNWKENTRYTISFDTYTTSIDANFAITYTDGTSSYIENVATNSWKKYKITSTANKTIKYLRARYSSGSTYIDLDTFMINEGTTALDYEPYGSNKWYIKKNIGKVNYNGSSIGSITTDGITYKTLYASGVPENKKTGTTNGLYFEKAKYVTTSSQKVENTIYENNANVVIVGGENDTIDTLKTKFNGSILYYVLATPTYIHITPTDYPILHTQLENIYNNSKSYDGQTNVTQTNDGLLFSINASALMKGDE